MDTVRNGILFRNGSAITATYEPYPEYHHLDIRDRYIEFRRDERPAVRGYRASNLIYDEFADVDWLDEFNSIQIGYTMNNEEIFNVWHEAAQYEFSLVDGRVEFKKKAAPDFGELSPSQELNDFINALVQGE